VCGHKTTNALDALVLRKQERV